MLEDELAQKERQEELAQKEKRAMLVQLDLKVSKDIADQMEHQVFLGHQVNPEQRDQREFKGH